ncbi:AraC family transcriptional regulator [Neorhizobium sp. JUb45]|uniref:helix-turn-helix transcriptional regulator n=1 Tax=unclassified Neorhizobium TaxID=2629175 RepID=UPI00104A7510|nr:AraC family transcriptional regulator [Neorhizobium sp. JUb45]
MTQLPDHSQARSSAVSARDFSQASMVFCDDYSLLTSKAGGDEENPLFEGTLGFRRLSTGINVSTAQMTALSDSDHSAIFPRSLSIVLSLEGRPSEFNAGNGCRTMTLQPGEAAFFSFSDDAHTTGRYSCGHRCKSMLIQLRPDLISEINLADFVETRTRSSEILSFAADVRMNALCGQLFDPGLCGTVGCLLMESYTLELVARAIEAAGRRSPDHAASVKGNDRMRMARIRELMLAEPGTEHSLSSLAREAGVSVSSLKNKFREIYGQSVFAFLHDVRMDRARQGIEREGWTVSQAAHFTGYRHGSNFSTAFHRYFGYSPGHLARGEI